MRLDGARLVLDGWAWQDPNAARGGEKPIPDGAHPGHTLYGWTAPELHEQSHGLAAGARCQLSGADGRMPARKAAEADRDPGGQLADREAG